MGGRDCAGVFPCFVFILCNACFCSPPINRSMSSRLFGFERLDFVSALFLEIFACFVLHYRNLRPSRRRVEQANLYGLCFAISPEPNCEPRSHMPETYQSIGRIEAGRQLHRAAALGSLESSK